MSQLKLTFYDGAGTIGGNRFLLEAGDTSLFLDFGTSFKKEAQFFDEFLKPRSTAGVEDLIELGLLPPLEGTYRKDLEVPERRIWERFGGRPQYRRFRPDAVLLSHGHMDHSGYISFLDPTIPVLTGTTTAFLTKAIQDTNSSGQEREVCYYSAREAKDGILRTQRMAPNSHRKFTLLDCPQNSQAEQGFWAECDSSRGLEPVPPTLCDGPEMAVGDLVVRYFPVDHSIPGAGAFAIKTPAGWIVYTGDLRLHGSHSASTRKFIDEVAGLQPLVLLCEGTHPGTTKPVAESSVRDRAEEAIAKEPGLVIADFGARNIERLLLFAEAADACGRRLAITTKDAHLLRALEAAGEEGAPDLLGDRRIAVYARQKGSIQRWETSLLSRLEGISGKVVTAREMRDDPASYVLCFSFYDLPDLVDIRPAHGTYIYSSSEAFNEETHIDLDRLRNWIAHFGLVLAGDPGDRAGRGREQGFHASGHIHGPGIVELVEKVKPEVLVPIHTESHDFFEQHFGAGQPAGGPGHLPRLVIPHEGYVLAL